MDILPLLLMLPLVASDPWLPPALGFTPATPIAAKPLRQKPSRLQKTAMSITLKLLPYEILDGTAASYADVSATFVNSASTPLEIEVQQIEIVADTTEKTVLLSATPQALKQSPHLLLKPSERRSVSYRLSVDSKRYEPGQLVIAHLRYRLKEQPSQTVRSLPEAVAFTIP